MAAPLISRVTGQVKQLLSLSGSTFNQNAVRCASKKASGATRNKRSRTVIKRRGPFVKEGQFVQMGNTLCRQVHLRYYPGENVALSYLNSLVALRPGTVRITTEVLSPYPDSPLYAATQQGMIIRRIFFHVIPEPQQGKFKLVSNV